MAADAGAYFLKAVVSEEASDANPFGIMTLDTEAYAKADPSKMWLRWRSQSSRLDDRTIQYKVVEYPDSHVIDQSQDLGVSEEYYAVNIVYSEGDSGYGTIINKLLGQISLRLVFIPRASLQFRERRTLHSTKTSSNLKTTLMLTTSAPSSTRMSKITPVASLAPTLGGMSRVGVTASTMKTVTVTLRVSVLLTSEPTVIL